MHHLDIGEITGPSRELIRYLKRILANRKTNARPGWYRLSSDLRGNDPIGNVRSRHFVSNSS
jgi:hypothetical protein